MASLELAIYFRLASNLHRSTYLYLQELGSKACINMPGPRYGISYLYYTTSLEVFHLKIIG